MRDLLGPQIVISCELHELHDLLLDARVPLLQALIVLLHAQLDLRQQRGVERRGVDLVPVLVLR